MKNHTRLAGGSAVTTHASVTLSPSTTDWGFGDDNSWLMVGATEIC